MTAPLARGIRSLSFTQTLTGSIESRYARQRVLSVLRSAEGTSYIEDVCERHLQLATAMLALY